MEVSRDLQRFQIIQQNSPPHDCSYIAGREAILDFRIFAYISADDYGELLRRGWRRHGLHFFRPDCRGCHSCRSLRLEVAHFRPSKSQRRTKKKNSEIELRVVEPTVSRRHIDLFNRYHQDMNARRGWPFRKKTEDAYIDSFLGCPGDFAREFQYWDGQDLVGIGLVDVTPNGLSSVYFYHDPAWRAAAPGVYSVLREIDYAIQHDVPYLYLGYWVHECPSMDYKANYRPHEILQGHVADDEAPSWSAADQ